MFVTWDDYGGFYDHVAPPQVDQFGYGFRGTVSRHLSILKARIHRQHCKRSHFDIEIR